MDTVTILRELWRRRLLVLGVGVLSLLAGAAVVVQLPSLKSRQHPVGVASTSILLDTPSSQVVDVAPKGSDSLGLRATLLASLMVDGVVKQQIAQVAGLNPSELAGVSTSATGGPAASPASSSTAVLTTRVVTDETGQDLPIIQVQVQASNATSAARLANAAVVGLRDYLDSKAAVQRIPDAQRLQITGLGVPQAHTAQQGPGKFIALLVAILVFGLGCAGILGMSALIRGWRAAAAREAAGESDDEPSREPPGADAADRSRAPRRPLKAAGEHEWSEEWLAPDPEVRSA